LVTEELAKSDYTIAADDDDNRSPYEWVMNIYIRLAGTKALSLNVAAEELRNCYCYNNTVCLITFSSRLKFQFYSTLSL